MPEPITDLIPEVRAALAKATPEQWVHETCDEGCCHYYDTLTTADANLIANAPAWLEALCDEVERLNDLASERRSEVVRITQEARDWESNAGEAEARAEAAEAAVERVRALAASDLLASPRDVLAALAGE